MVAHRSAVTGCGKEPIQGTHPNCGAVTLGSRWGGNPGLREVTSARSAVGRRGGVGYGDGWSEFIRPGPLGIPKLATNFQVW